MSEAPAPAEMQEAELTPDLLRELLRELSEAGHILEVRVQERRERLSGLAGKDRLAALADELSAGAIRALQIRYAHGGSDWIDTLLRRGSAIRLVRARAPTTAR